MEYDSLLKIEENKKVDVIVSLLQSHRSQIMTWHNQAYVAATTSFGLLPVMAKYWLEIQHKSPSALVAFLIAVALLAYGTREYLPTAQKNYEGNEEAKLKCEYALRLKDEGIYFSAARFYWRTEGNDQGMECEDIKTLTNLYLGASVLVISVGVVGYFKPLR